MIASQRRLLGIAVVALGAVGAALVSQHVYDMQPCPWCVLQRFVFVAIGVVALLGSFVPMAALRRAALAVVVLLAASGVAAALWQHFVAAASASCDLTLADRIISGLKLDETWPKVFMPMASCADAKVMLLGLPYEAWSLMLFAGIAVAAAMALRVPRRAAFG